jgi:VTC domain
MPSAAEPNTPLAVPTATSLEREIKFLVPAARSGSLRAWLDAACMPERRYPPALVCTTYYDTPGFAFLGEKIDSDYLKTKLRVRWYASLDGNPAGSAVFAELKYRVGNRRDKCRVPLDADPAALGALPLESPVWTSLLDPLRVKAPLLPGRLDPILTLRYARYRYLDRPTAGRVTLDDAVALTALNRARVTGHAPVRLPNAVLEYKGASDDLPRHLTPAIRFGARRGAYSKYLAAYQASTGLLL